MSLTRKRKRGRYTVWEASTLNDILDFVSDRLDTEHLYRGQTQDLPLLPSVARCRSDYTIRELEEILLREFRRSAPVSEGRPQNHWEWLALAQHHRLPTRLLDWAKSPLTAAWFATAPCPGEHGPAVIWVFEPDADEYVNDIEEQEPFSTSHVIVFEPPRITSRIAAQHSVFTVHPISRRARKVAPFEELRGGCLEKIEIPRDSVAPMRRLLNSLGYNQGGIYLDLDSTALRIKDDFTYGADE